MPHPPEPGSESSSKSSTERLAVARITGAHGLRGEVRIESLSGEHQHLFRLSRAFLDSIGEWRELSIRGGGNRLIADIAGVDSAEAAAELRGTLLLVPRDQAAPLGADEYYIADLIGMDVLFRHRRRASVTGVWDSGADTMLELSLLSGGVRHVPLNRRFVRAVRMRRRRIHLRVDWILD